MRPRITQSQLDEILATERDVKALRELAERYYILLRGVSESQWHRSMTPFWNERRKEVQAKAEELGISDAEKAEEG